MGVDAYLLITGLILLAAVYICLPLALHVHMKYRAREALMCPETGRLTSIQIDAARAARTALFGKPKLDITDCARWPERKDCAQLCMGGHK